MKLENFNLNNEKIELIHKYIKLLTEYNQKFNLISKHTVDDILDRHIIDSLQLVKYIDSNAKKIADLGSGAGLPGIVLAIALDNIEFCLVESNGKKASFLQTVVKELGLLNVKVVNDRIETLQGKGIYFDIITARALASLDILWSLSANILGNNGYTLFLKGRKHKEETSALLKKNKGLKIDFLDALVEESKIVKIHKKGK